MAVELSGENIYISTNKVTLIRRFKELWSYRTLLWTLTWRDIRVRYKQSLLGIAWAMFIPVSMTLLFSFVFTKIVAVKTDIPYPIFAYCGLLPWQFFASATTAATNSLIANRSLITKIYFPSEVFPISSIIAAFVDFLVGSIILVALIVYFYFAGAPILISWTVLLVIPVIFVQILFMTGISFFLSMGNLFFRDVRYIYNVIISLWMFATSVVFPMKVSSPELQRALNLNPMTHIIDAYRDVLLRGKIPDLYTFGYTIIISLIICFLGWIIFYKMQSKFAEKA